MRAATSVIMALCRHVERERRRVRRSHEQYLLAAADAAQCRVERDEARAIAARLWRDPHDDALGDRERDLVRAWSADLAGDAETIIRRVAPCLLCGGRGEVEDPEVQDLMRCPSCQGAGGAT